MKEIKRKSFPKGGGYFDVVAIFEDGSEKLLAAWVGKKEAAAIVRGMP